MLENESKDLLSNSQLKNDAWWRAVLDDEQKQGGSDFIQRDGVDYLASADGTDWVKVSEMAASETLLECKVIDHNHGGLLVQHKEFQGFVPLSHLVDGDPDQILDHINDYTGRVLDLRIIEIDSSRNRVVLSQRAAKTSVGEREQLMSGLEKGLILEGPVTNITKFGIFVDLGGVEGLVHVSELSWSRVNHPKQVVEWGQNVKVKVLDIDRSRNRVALSLKQLYPNPWKTVTERYKPGDVMTAVIIEVMRFGAFARLEDELVGLVHISEMGLGQGEQPWKVFKIGSLIKVRILKLDSENHRIGLALEG